MPRIIVRHTPADLARVVLEPLGEGKPDAKYLALARGNPPVAIQAHALGVGVADLDLPKRRVVDEKPLRLAKRIVMLPIWSEYPDTMC